MYSASYTEGPWYSRSSPVALQLLVVEGNSLGLKLKISKTKVVQWFFIGFEPNI